LGSPLPPEAEGSPARPLALALRAAVKLARTMGVYNDEALRQLVELREKGSELTAEQKQALVGWLQTDDGLRRELQSELRAAGYDPRPTPLSAAHEEELRAKGLLESGSFVKRLVEAVRARFGRT
jgi:hypothetical protein